MAFELSEGNFKNSAAWRLQGHWFFTDPSYLWRGYICEAKPIETILDEGGIETVHLPFKYGGDWHYGCAQPTSDFGIGPRGNLLQLHFEASLFYRYEEQALGRYIANVWRRDNGKVRRVRWREGRNLSRRWQQHRKILLFSLPHERDVKLNTVMSTGRVICMIIS